MKDPYSMRRAQLRAARELLGMSQKDLAARMDVSINKISKAETGETKSGDVLIEIQSALEALGILFTKSGVEISQAAVEIIEGKDCYLRLLDDVYQTLIHEQGKELLIMFSSDKISPPEVNNRYTFMRSQGVTMRQLIKTGDNYIMGALKEYRTIPEEYFTNIVTLVYAGKVAQVSGDETRVTIHHDNKLAERERKIFAYLWDTGEKPRKSTAQVKF